MSEILLYLKPIVIHKYQKNFKLDLESIKRTFTLRQSRPSNRLNRLMEWRSAGDNQQSRNTHGHMSTSNSQRALKRRRTSHRSSYYETVPIDDDDDGDYSVVYHREAMPRRLGNEVVIGTSSRSVALDDNQWASKVTWAPQDDDNYALDPDGDSYDMAVEAEVMEEDDVQEDDAQEDDAQEDDASRKKTHRSRVSVSMVFYFVARRVISNDY